MNTPNAIWAILIGTAIWVTQTYFPGAEWAGPVVTLLVAVAKIIQVNLPAQATARGAEAPGKMRRFWTD